MPDLIAKPARRCPGMRDGYPRARDWLGVWPLWEGQGGKAYDVANPFDIAKHGTLTSMDPPTDWRGSPIGDVLDFDGVNDGIAIGALDFTKEEMAVSGMTVLAWFAPGTVTLDNTEYFIAGSSGGNHGAWSAAGLIYHCGAAYHRVGFQTYDGDYVTIWSAEADDDFAVGKWVCLVGVLMPGATASYLYKDGIQVASGSPGGSPDFDPLYTWIGHKETTGFEFLGQIGFVAICGRGLSAAEARGHSHGWPLITPRKRTYLYYQAPAVTPRGRRALLGVGV